MSDARAGQADATRMSASRGGHWTARPYAEQNQSGGESVWREEQSEIRYSGDDTESGLPFVGPESAGAGLLQVRSIEFFVFILKKKQS